MTKKDFIALADAIRATKPTTDNDTEGWGISQWEADVKALADFCQSQNDRFNRERWLDYINGADHCPVPMAVRKRRVAIKHMTPQEYDKCFGQGDSISKI